MFILRVEKDCVAVSYKLAVAGVNTPTDYAGNYIYENDNLKQISQPEGYIEPDGTGWQYVYYLKDHQNNIRITFADVNDNGEIETGSSYSEIRREQNYYPFGLEYKGYNNVSYGVKNNLKTFQDQEFTEDLGLNTHEWKYRVSDPAIGRFWQIDPLADEYSYQSPYNFSENRVIDGVELEGLEYVPINGDGIASAVENKIKNGYKATSSFFNRIGNAIGNALKARGGNPIYGSGGDNSQGNGAPKKNAGPSIDFNDFPVPIGGGGGTKNITDNAATVLDHLLENLEAGQQLGDGLLELNEVISGNSEVETDTTLSVTTYSVSETITDPETGEVTVVYGDKDTRDTTVTKAQVGNVKKFENQQQSQYQRSVDDILSGNN